MGSYKITGGIPLSGTVEPITNKNSILKLIPAAILTSQPVTLHNVPKTTDVSVLLSLFKLLGGSVHYFNKGTSIKLTAQNINETIIPASISQKARATLVFLGPLLARFGETGIGESGGCNLGNRPIDTHFRNFKKLGSTVTHDSGGFYIKRTNHDDVFIWQDEAGVTPTENLIMASVLGKSKVTIYNAACEPHTQDLCNMLTQMGANIDGIGSNRLVISGVPELNGTEYTPIVEHLDVGTYIAAAAITGGQITIKNAIPEHMTQILTMYDRLGVHVEINRNDIYVPAKQKLEIKPDIRGGINKIDAQPWPGFPVDLLPVALVLATQSKGSIIIHNKMFETGMFFVDELIKMKAQLVLADPHRVITMGKAQLSGTTVHAPNIIQAGVALFLAALCAQGETIIHDIDIIKRRYPNIAESYRSLGAQIEEI